MNQVNLKLFFLIFIGLIFFFGINASLRKNDINSEFALENIHHKIELLLTENEFTVEKNNAPPNTVFYLPIYFKSEGCDKIYIAIPVNINMEAEAYLARIVPNGYRLNYYFYNTHSNKPEKWKFFFMYINEKFLSIFRNNKFLPSNALLITATPLECNNLEIKWNSVWMKSNY